MMVEKCSYALSGKINPDNRQGPLKSARRKLKLKSHSFSDCVMQVTSCFIIYKICMMWENAISHTRLPEKQRRDAKRREYVQWLALTSKSGLGTSSTSSTWEIVRNKELQAPSQTYRSSIRVLLRSQVICMHVNVWEALFNWSCGGLVFTLPFYSL